MDRIFRRPTWAVQKYIHVGLITWASQSHGLVSRAELAYAEAHPSASGAHYRHGLIAELRFTFAERDIPHKSVFNT